MREKCIEKVRAIKLRKEGKSYSEILEEVPVAKSTLSIWLRDIGLATPQAQKITEKRIAGQKRGAEAKRAQRRLLQQEIYSRAENDLGLITQRDLFILGTALYWAEGSKEYDYRPGSTMGFTNEDPEMVNTFMTFLCTSLNVEPARIRCEIYIHVDRILEKERILKFWCERTGLPKTSFRIYLKRNSRSTKDSKGIDYNGTMRIKVESSSDLVRYMDGCARGIVKQIGGWCNW